MTCNLLLVGCGNMGRALLDGWLTIGLIGHAVVVESNDLSIQSSRVKTRDPSRNNTMDTPSARGMTTKVESESQIPSAFIPDMIVLAVKPQMLAEVLPAYKRYAGKAPFLSIAAGKTLDFFAQHLGQDAAVIRSMPNLPATVGQGATVCVANAVTKKEQRALAATLLEAVGTVDWTPEDQLDAVTALSGSGPAYVFYLVEAMEKAAIELGLAPELAAKLARQTIVGAAEMLRKSPENAAMLRARVTSKGGTTAAALKILMENDALFSIMRSAMSAAAERSKELAQQ